MRARCRPVIILVLTVLLGLLAVAPSGRAEVAATPRPQAPVVTEVTHTSGPAAGGTTIVVKGRHLSGAKKVLFGRVKGVDVTVISHRKIEVTTPRHAPGTFPVFVRTGGGKSKAGPRFTFLAATPPTPPATPGPTVTGVSPGSGPTAGGTAVTITGAELDAVTTLTVDGAAVMFDRVSPSQLNATMPAHTSGDVQVQVHGPHGQSPAWNTGLFTYTDASGPVPTTAPLPPDATTSHAWLHGLDCPVAGACVGVGGYSVGGNPTPFSVQLDQGRWTPARVPSAGPASLSDVACTSATRCLAVGTQTVAGIDVPFTVVWDGDSWHELAWDVPDDLEYTSAMAVDCGSDACAVVGIYATDGLEARAWLLGTYSAATWTESTQADPGYLQGLDLSCAGSLECTAVAGDNGATRVQTLSSGSWTASTLPDLDDEDVHLRAVECPEPAHCVATGSVGTDGSLARYDAGSWTLSEPAQPFATGGLACDSVTHCVGSEIRGVQRPPLSCCNTYVDYYGTLSTIGAASVSSVTKLINDSYVPPGLGAGMSLPVCSGAGLCGAVGDFAFRCLTASAQAGELVVDLFDTQVSPGECINDAVAADSDDTAVSVGVYFRSGPSGGGPLIISGIPLA